MCECMVHVLVYLVHLLSLAWVLLGLTVVSALPWDFLDSPSVMGLFYWLSFGLLEGFGSR